MSIYKSYLFTKNKIISKHEVQNSYLESNFTFLHFSSKLDGHNFEKLHTVAHNFSLTKIYPFYFGTDEIIFLLFCFLFLAIEFKSHFVLIWLLTVLLLAIRFLKFHKGSLYYIDSLRYWLFRIRVFQNLVKFIVESSSRWIANGWEELKLTWKMNLINHFHINAIVPSLVK